MTRIAVVTTFNESSYDSYAGRMLETFDHFWPRDVQLLAYSEQFMPSMRSDRIEFRDLLEASPELVAFRERHRNNPRANGRASRRLRLRLEWRKPKIRLLRVCDADSFMWQAVRFSHKTFTIFHAAAHCDADVLYWLDSDVITRRPVPQSFIDKMMPQKAMLSHIERRKFSDCCLMGFNLRHPLMSSFMAAFRHLYVADALFKYPQYHDSYLFDVMRRKYERMGALSHDLARGVGQEHGHVFDHCDLGIYFDHLKGARKDTDPKPEPVFQDLAGASSL
jgi:hypothetical protein